MVRTRRVRRPGVGVVAIVLLGLMGTACGDGERRASAAESPRDAENGRSTGRSGSPEQVGTIRARLDGEDRVWYLVAGEVEGRRQSSALWLATDGDERMAVLAGFDTPDVPLESFRMDPETGEYSYGSYRGSMLAIGFDFEAEDFERTATLPGSASAWVMYTPEVETGEMDLSSIYMLAEGSVDVNLIDARRGADSEFAGTFEGALGRMDRSERIQVADGRFEVQGAIYWEPEAEEPEPEPQ